jgi:hypothetical protein
MGFIEKYGVFIMAILIGGGFAFGGMASYAGLVDTGSSNNGDQEANITLPQQNYRDGSFGRSSQEKLYMAGQTDSVFITGYYTTSEEKQQVEELETVAQNFNGRAYVEIVNASETTVREEVSDYPAALVIGSNRASPTAMVENATVPSVTQAACNAVREYGNLAAQCVS